MLIFILLHLLVIKRSNKNSSVVGSYFIVFSLLSVSQFNNIKLLLYDSSSANSLFLCFCFFFFLRGKLKKRRFDPEVIETEKKFFCPGPTSFASFRISDLKGIWKPTGSRICQTVSVLWVSKHWRKYNFGRSTDIVHEWISLTY